MADQIKNAKLGEVSSQNKSSSGDGANGGVTPRKEPVFKEKPERKLPVFANEVRQHSDDDFDDDIDFTSDSVAMPFAMGSILNMDASELGSGYSTPVPEKKPRKAKKSKAKNKYKASKKELDDFAKMDPTGAEQFDELSFMGGTMPEVGSMGVDTYLDLANLASAPYGVDGYLDLNNTLSKAYVPTYEAENALMAKQLGYDVDINEVEPMPERRPFVEKDTKDASSDNGNEESEALLAEAKAEKQRKKDAAVAKAMEKADRRADELAALESNAPVKAEKPEKVKKEKKVDPGIEEAEELLEAAAAEKARKKELRSNDVFAIEARKKFEEEFQAEWGDPGIEEAKELLAADAAERQRLKEQRRAKRNKGDEDAVVVETVSVNSLGEDGDDTAPLTGADSNKKIVLLVPNGNGSQPIGVIAPDYADVEAYSVDDFTGAELPVEAKHFSTDAYDNSKGTKADKRAEREELAALAAVMKQQKKEDKALEKAAKASAWDKAAETVYADVEPYFPEEAPARVDAPKVKKEFSTAAYDKANDRKHNKAAVAAALVAFYNGNKPVAVQKVKTVSAPQEIIYPDVDYTEGYDPNWAEKQEAAEAAFKEAKRIEREAAKAQSAEKREVNNQSRYETHEAKMLLEREQRDALLLTYKEEKERQKALKAAEKAAKRNVEPENVTEVIYDDFTELFDKEAYDAEKQAVVDAELKAKADAKALKEAERFAKSEKKDAKIVSAYEKETAETLEANARETEMDAIRKQYKAEAKARAKEEKAEAKAEKLAKANAPKPEVIYDDFTELFDKEAYDAEKAAEAAAVEAAKAAALAQKEAKRTEKAEKREAKMSDKYDAATEKSTVKAEKKAELKALGNESIKENKERKAAEKAAEEAERIAKAKNSKPEVIYDDFTETFDSEAYYAEKAAAEAAEALAKREAKENKLAAEMAAELEIAVKEYEMDSFRKQYKAEAKARAKEEKAQVEAERLDKINATKPEGVYSDFTELFDKEAYDADKQAVVEAKKQAKADEEALKEAKRNEKAATREGKMSANFDAAIVKAEKKEELKTLGNESIKENKERKAEEKAEIKAEKLAKKNAPKPEVIYDDFTELFDKEAYDAEKAAEAAAVEAAKAAALAEKEAKRTEQAEKREAKMSDKYDAATEKSLTKADKKAELKELGNESIKENKERKAEEKAEAKAEKLAKKNAPKPEVIYDDFTELFDKEAYDSEKAAEAAAVEAAKAAALAEKEAKRHEKAEKQDAKDVKVYEKETAEALEADAKEKEMDSFRKQYKAEAKARAKEEKAQAEAERIAKANAPKPEVIYPDPELRFGEVDAETKALIDTAPEDVLEGYKPKSVAVRDLVRAAKEDKQLQILIKKDKGTVKRVKHDLETLELAEKFVDDGALEMADTKTVVRDAKQFDKDVKEQKLIKEYDNEVARSLEDEEKLYIAKEYSTELAIRRKRIKRAKKFDKSGKFMLEYGSTYDPEWDGEFNNYGLPKEHPFTEGVKLSSSRRRTPKKERLSYFNKDNLSALARSQCKVDLKMIESRVEAEHMALQLEVSKFVQDFSGEYRSKKEKRWFRDSKEKLKNIKLKLASAQKFEKLDNERYYSVVGTDYDRVELPESADREALVAMREELMRLLDIRDEINGELIELYTGSEDGKANMRGRTRVTLKARKRAHLGFRRYFRVLNKRHVSKNEKMRIFDRMDEIVELKGDIARLSYILRKEKPTGKLKREYVRELKAAKRDSRILKKSVERSTVKALKRAKKRELRMWTMIFTYGMLVLVGLFVLAMVTMGPEILRASKLILPENLHQYIDQLLGKWPL